MMIGDVLAVVAGVLATGATLAAIFLTIALLFREPAQRAQFALAHNTGRAFGIGIGIAIVAGAFGMILSGQPNGLLKVVGYAILIGLFALASLGSSGLGLLVAERIAQMDSRVGKLKGLWRSYLLIVCAGFLPFVGWFVVFPFMLVFSLGSGVIALGDMRPTTPCYHAYGNAGNRAGSVRIDDLPRDRRMNRRDCLTAGLIGVGGIAAGLASSGCNQIRARLVPMHDTSRHDSPIAPIGVEAGPALRLLNRAAFGPGPGDLAKVEAKGASAWLDEQLAAPNDDSGEPAALQLRLSPIAALNSVAPDDLAGLGENDVLTQLQQAAILRAVYSPWQLRERMVDFWSNHFNIYAHKNEGTFLLAGDSVKVIRTHALGYFPNLLRASAHSPAMLGYLDNQQNRSGVANENYARELMELHSLGVDGGYTQKDVQEVARCLTGWTIEDRFLRRKGTFRFDETRHDDTPKTVLGVTISAGGGESDGDTVLNLLAKHPATARHIARKMVHHFVGADDAALTATIAQIYTQTQGHIPSMLRGIFTSAPFANAAPALKRPFDFLAASLRATNAETDGGAELQKHLARMGQPLYQWPMPDGYPDRTAAWTGTLLHRWNFAVALANGGIRGTHVEHPKLHEGGSPERLIESVLAQSAAADALQPLRTALAGFDDVATRTALLLSSPQFQWR